MDKKEPVFPTAANVGDAVGKRVLSYDDYIAGTRKILNASKSEQEPYQTTVAGREYIVLPNVFSPKYFNDTDEFARHLPIREGDEVLEIGPGTGAISITAAYNGAEKVIAIDINPDAVKNTQENIDLHKMRSRIEVRQGNVYDALREDEKFDTIFWNTPFGLVPEGDIPDLERSVYDPGYQSTEAFIKQAKQHLKADGKLLIGFSTTLGRFDLLQKFCDEVGFELRLLYEVESEEEHPVKFEIFEATPIESKLENGV